MTNRTDDPPAGPTPGPRPSAARMRILDTVDRLFYDEGIRSVGVHRVVDESQVTRVTLYRHFPTKDDLVVAYLRRRAEQDRQQVARVVEASAGDARQALRGLARHLVDTGFGDLQRGCPFINAAAEFADLSHPARRIVTDHRVWFTGVMEDMLRDAGDPTPGGTARVLMMLRTGAVVASALDEQPSIGADFLDAVDRLLDAGHAAGR